MPENKDAEADVHAALEPSALLKLQIAASGPVSVAAFMQRSNAMYYAAGDPFGVAGDFTTAPEISQMFGELIGLWLADQWVRAGRPAAATYVELGPGRGTLAADCLRSAATFGLKPSVDLLENSAALRKLQASQLPQARFHAVVDTLPTAGPLLIVANEFFDALPVHQLVSTADGWRERMIAVGDDGGFHAVPGHRPVDAVVPDLVRGAPEGSIVEQCREGAAILLALVRRIAAQGGVMLIIDYGHDRCGIGETLQAVRGHMPAALFGALGSADLSAHVDFQELANIGRAADMAVHGPVPQGAWLQALGIDARADTLAQATPDRRTMIQAARDRLTAPEHMGNLFKVLAIGAPGWPIPAGF